MEENKKGKNLWRREHMIEMYKSLRMQMAIIS